MGQYVIRRVLMLIPTLLAVYTITFLLIHATPGGPWDEADKPLSPAAVAALNKAYGLDKPVWQQYTDYLLNALRGDFGPSYTQTSRTVADIIRDFFPVSIKLGLLAMAIAVVLGLTAGTISAVKHNTPLDYFAGFGAIIGISVPSYVVASLLLLLLASSLHLVPTSGWKGVFSREAIVPAIALALGPAAILARYTRASLLDVLRQDYVRTARAKGVHERAVIVRHGLRNALIPVVTVMGLSLANVVTGSFFVETVCGVPGLGRYFVRSVGGRDYSVILGITLLFAVIISVMNLLVDLMYAVLDPRIAYD
jgi:ABC-type dipeptide/oligopeptide/nickel transport system permease component